MKSVQFKVPKILMYGPSSHVRRSKRSLTERDRHYLAQSPVPGISDPFREFNKGSPKSKLQPIVLKSRLSPSPKNVDNISIRIPEITEDGKLRLNKHFLPALKCAKPYGSNSPQLQFSTMYKYKSEKELATQSYRFDSIRNENEEGSKLDVSFGNNGQSLEQDSINPFVSF